MNVITALTINDQRARPVPACGDGMKIIHYLPATANGNFLESTHALPSS